MRPRSILLTVLALVVGLGALIQHREKILLELGLEAWDPSHYRAVDLAKSARSLQRYHTNYFTIQNRLELEGGVIDPNGWTVERIEGSRFAVSYRSKVDDRTVEYDFEVDVGLREVFVRRDDPGRPARITDDLVEEPAPAAPSEAPATGEPPAAAPDGR